MISEHDRLLKIDEVQQLCEKEFLIYRPTWNLIISSLKWSMQKTIVEIEERILVCDGKRDQHRMKMMKRNWQLIIETLKWVIGDTPVDPIGSRNLLGY